MSIFMKILQMEEELFHAHRQIEKHDMTKLTVAFRNSANARNCFMTLKFNYTKEL
jgi:hypothetical protein